jgi:hypothetical protein
MTDAYLQGFDALFPHASAAFNGRSYFVWSPGDPHILGAYSYLAVGQYTAFNDIQDAREGNLHFAGEQTSLNFQGYIEGALRSRNRSRRQPAQTVAAMTCEHRFPSKPAGLSRLVRPGQNAHVHHGGVNHLSPSTAKPRRTRPA